MFAICRLERTNYLPSRRRGYDADAPLLLFLLRAVVALLVCSAMCGHKMVTSAFPRRPLLDHNVPNDNGEDILAGADFLSLIDDSAYDNYEIVTDEITETTFSPEFETTEPYIRSTRQATLYNSPFVEGVVSNSSPSPSKELSSLSTSLGEAFKPVSLTSESTSDSSVTDGIIVAMRVSSTVNSRINKNNRDFSQLDQTYLTSETHPGIPAESSKSELSVDEKEPMIKTGDSRTSFSGELTASIQTLPSSQHVSFNNADFLNQQGDADNMRVSSTVNSRINNRDFSQLDQTYLTSETRPGIPAESSKSELNVDEKEPVVKTADPRTSFSGELAASIQSLPSSQHISFNNAGFLNQQGDVDKIPPFHHSVIYHDQPKEPSQARSVSFSTVIQGIPQSAPHPQSDDALHHERRERNYDDSRSAFNIFQANDKSYTKNETKPATIQGQNNYYFSTTPPTNNWERPEQNYEQRQTTKSPNPTTEANWAKPYPPPNAVPKVYGRPEQNYEVDEAVSVVTNGRTHGVQSSPNPRNKQDKTSNKTEKDDNQKVGYVVEGRNYRKYRVEERTADGFIVGEYGVVSHDDGSLRGVRYTADGTINPRLIYDALMKFLSL